MSLRTHSLVLAVVACTLGTGCAAVFKGSKQTVRIDAVPEGSDVRADGRYLGAAPVDAEIDRDRSQNVRVTKDGFVEQHVQLRKKADTPWFFWDIATCVVPITLCIPVLVDAISGAWYSYDDVYRVKLDPALVPPVGKAEPRVVLPPHVPSAPAAEGAATP